MRQALGSGGDAEALRARWQLDAGRDPQDALARGRRRFDQAFESDHSDADLCVHRAQLELTAIEAALRRHRSPAQAMAEAARWLDRAEKLDPESGAPLWVGRAWLHRWRAEWRPATLDGEISLGLAAAQRALDKNPNAAEAHAVAGALHLAAAQAGRRDHAALARQELARALEIDRWLSRRLLPLSEAAKPL
jgi:hypothetical protein